MSELNIKWVGAHSNNYEKGRRGKNPELVIMHWIVGNLSSADTTFANPNRGASAHYGIEGNTIHQWVKEKDTSYGASNFDINLRGINIEHSGGELLADGTRRKPSEATHQTSARLIADICKRYDIPIDAKHILPHNKFSNTQCPGSLDIKRIIDLAKKEGAQPEPPSDNKQLVTDILLALKGETSENEIAAWVERFENPKTMIEELLSGDGAVHARWIRPEVLEAVETYQVALNQCKRDLEECRQAPPEPPRDDDSIQFTNPIARALYRIAKQLG